jgi:hypothetical protein
MQIGPFDAETAAARAGEPVPSRHVYPTSRPPEAATTAEPDSSAPSPGAGRRTPQTPPVFTDRLKGALHREGRLADLAGGLTRTQVDRMLAGLPPGGSDGDFAHMSPKQLKALGHLMRGEAGPLEPGQSRRYTFDPSLPVDGTTRPA